MPFIQDVDPKLTLTRVAAAPALVAEVAKITGQKLEVSPQLATDILMISVENVGANEVLGKLAIAATARWEPTENGYRLVPDKSARNIEASAERARRLQRLTEGLKKKKEAEAKAMAEIKAQVKAQAAAKPVGKPRKKADDTNDEPDAMPMPFMGMGNVDGFIPMLDLATVANMEPGDRIVFATNPNGAQMRLGGDPSAIVAAWIDQHNKSATGVASGMDEMPDEMQALMKGPVGDQMRKMSQPIKGRATKVIVVASRGGSSPMMMGGFDRGVKLQVRAYGADGGVLIEENGTLDASMMEMIAKMTGEKPAASGKTTPIAYSADAKALIGTSGREGGFMAGDFSTGYAVPASLREKIFAPQKFEPLALVPGESLAAYAKARRMPLVACVPDDAYPGLLEEAPKTIEDVAEGLKGAGPMRIVPDATYLVVRPTEPESARRNRVDRNALGDLMRAIDANDTPSLDDLSAFALKSPAPDRNALVQSILTQFVPTTLFTMSGAPSWDGLRLYGTLSPAQRQALASGGRVPFSTVTPAGQDALAAMLYGAGGELTVERGGKPAETDFFSTMMAKAMGGGSVDARDEPTEIAPNGLPAAGYLQASVESDTILRPVGSGGPIYYALGTDELAMFRMVAQSAAGDAMGDRLKMPEAGRVGTRALWRLRGYVGTNAYVTTTLTDDHTPKDGTQVAFAALPSDLQAKVNAKVEKIKKSPLGAMMTMGKP